MLYLTIFQKGFNYSQDGPGNRLVFHLQNCNMHCSWCANPEGMTPKNVLTVSKNIELSELIEEILSCRSLFFDGGGVTFTGGEPTLQFDALLTLFKELHTHNIHITLETNGTHPNLELLFPYINLLIIDLKQVDDEVHRKFTGISNFTTKSNIGKAMSNHSNVLIRTPLINGVNSDRKYIAGFISFYRQFPLENTCFELLKYHEYGKVKWEQCNLPYRMPDGYVTDELRDTYETEYRNNGLQVVRT